MVTDQPVVIKLLLEGNGKGLEGNVQMIKIAAIACGRFLMLTGSWLADSFGNNFEAQPGYDFLRAEHQV